ncbi:O-phosphoseryl-tRNA(Sec) selenium transferase-like isoform X2 [Rhopilema esculentum]|eukprot:gene11909-2475_t
MNSANLQLAGKIVSQSYAQQAADAKAGLENKIKLLLEQRKLPAEGWDDFTIEYLLNEMALMDSNNFSGNVGIGEREARFASRLVAKRHYYLGHGIGRSGDISEVQPKAAGSSLISKLTNSFVLDILHATGARHVQHCLVVPVATGMALVLTMLSLKALRPHAKYVVWPRIDQKSCFKSILTAGFQPVIIQNVLVGDELTTDLGEISNQVKKIGAENVLCVMSTTSCFAPRVPDRVEEIAIICKDFDIPHIINNAYGLQSSKCMHIIDQASRKGRVDAFVQSTDKNFMVPVGGSIIAGHDESFIDGISKTYPGRASASPTIDLFITLLSLGVNGYKNLLAERKESYILLMSELDTVCRTYDERLLDTKHNPISLAITLDNLVPGASFERNSLTEFGSMLFKRCVSGTRVIAAGDSKTIGSYTFENWGSHSNNYPFSYMTAAAAVGLQRSEIDVFVKRLNKIFSKLKRKNTKGENSREQYGDADVS